MPDLDPVVIEFESPTQGSAGGPSGWRSKLPKLSPKGTKLLIAIGAGTIIVSMVTFTIFSVLSANKEFSKTHGLDANEQKVDDSELSQAALPGGNIATGTGGTTGKNAPVIKLTAQPASVSKGSKSHLKWSVSNNPKSCEASDDWDGKKDAKGEVDTSALTKVQTYLFTLTCKTDTGTGFATVSVGVIEQGGTGDVARRPEVTLAANPASVYTGYSSTLVWRTTNSPTSCTASDDWSGAKSASGSQASTGKLSSAKTYKYTLTCKNSAGTGFATTTVKATKPPANIPIVTISSSPAGPVEPGSSVTLKWSSTNNPSSCKASGDWSGSKSDSGSEKITNMTSIKTYTFSIDCKNDAGGTFDSANVIVVPGLPSVSITASPSNMYTGNSSTLTWSATKSPTSCTASGDWSGAKPASGTATTGSLSTAKTYTYSLQCENEGGKSTTKSATILVSLPPVPVVSLSANPITINTGSSASLTWSATNSPTSCTASGDWSGSKSSSGTQSTGTLNTVKTYSYSLNCSNDGGNRSASTSVNVTSGSSSNPPVVTLNAGSTTIGTGDSTTLTWNATNSPTSCTASGSWSGSKSGSGSASTGTLSSVGTYTYTLNCSNSAGSDSDSVTVTVIAKPSVTISVSPSTINTGSSSTISWSVSGSPTSCTAGGSWSGSKASSGSQSTGTMSSAGSFIYSLSCTNAGGTGSNSATLTVQNPAPVYCSGKTPCYGPSDLAAHASPGNCWGWNLDWVVNITTFRPSHPGGIKSGSTSTIENASATCNHNIASILAGSASIPGYKDSGGSTTHNHKSATKNNSASSDMASFRVGYYDASKP